MDLISVLKIRLNEIQKTRKIIFYINKSTVGEKTGFVLENTILRKILLLIFIVGGTYLIFLFTGIILFFLNNNETFTSIVLNSIQSTNSLISFFMIILFFLIFFTRYFMVNDFFQNKKVKMILFSSPLNGWKLISGMLLSGFFIFDLLVPILNVVLIFWLNFIENENLDFSWTTFVFQAFFVFIVSFIFSMFSSSITYRYKIEKMTFLSKELKILFFVLVLPPFISLIPFFSPISIISPISLSARILIAIYSWNLFEAFYLFFLYLLIILILIPFIVRDISLQFIYDEVGFSNNKRYFRWKFSQTIALLLNTRTEFVDVVFLKEDWESNRPAKFILLSIISLVILYSLNRMLINNSIFWSSEILLYILMFLSIIPPIVTFLYSQIENSIFSFRDNKLLLFKSTPHGISKLIKIRIIIFLIWQIPFLLVISLFSQFVNHNYSFLSVFLFGISIVILVTVISLFFKAISPIFGRISEFFGFNVAIIINFPFIFTSVSIVLLIPFILLSIISIPVELIVILCFAFSIIVGYIILQVSIKLVDNSEFFI